MHSRLRLAAVGLLTLVASAARAQTTSPASIYGVQVKVAVNSAGRAHVVERYRVPRDTGALKLQLLARACASVSGVTLSNYANARILASTVNGPWVIFRDTTTGGRVYNADSSGFEISYTISLGATSADIPLVHLPRPIPRLEEEREGSVSLSVETDAEVVFPRLTRAAPGQPWVGRFVAIPSFVRVDRNNGAATSADECAASGPSDSTDGGLTWRFWTLLAIMVAWVPLYLAWARRAQAGDA